MTFNNVQIKYDFKVIINGREVPIHPGMGLGKIKITKNRIRIGGYTLSEDKGRFEPTFKVRLLAFFKKIFPF